MNPSTFGMMMLDNVTTLGGCINNQQYSSSNVRQVIKNSNIKISNFIMGDGIFNIIDSYVEMTYPNTQPFDIRGGSSATMYIKGSTIITPDSSKYDITSQTDAGICIVDSSLNLNAQTFIYGGKTIDYTRFYINVNGRYAKFDPLDDAGNRILSTLFF